MSGNLKNLIAMMELMSAPKETARERREQRRKANYVPPRSMTEKEKQHYAIHKNLHALNS